MPFHPAYFATRFRCPSAHPAWPDRFAIISACATTGEHWDAAREAAADAALHAALVARGLWVARITGYSPETGHAEPSWAAAMPLADAVALGADFAQDAIYWVDGDVLSVHRCRGDGATAPVGLFRERLD